MLVPLHSRTFPSLRRRIPKVLGTYTFLGCFEVYFVHNLLLGDCFFLSQYELDEGSCINFMFRRIIGSFQEMTVKFLCNFRFEIITCPHSLHERLILILGQTLQLALFLFGQVIVDIVVINLAFRGQVSSVSLLLRVHATVIQILEVHRPVYIQRVVKTGRCIVKSLVNLVHSYNAFMVRRPKCVFKLFRIFVFHGYFHALLFFLFVFDPHSP